MRVFKVGQSAKRIYLTLFFKNNLMEDATMLIETDTRITDFKARYKSGVLKYRQMGYWRPDYQPKDTDIICVFRITPPPLPPGPRRARCRRRGSR